MRGLLRDLYALVSELERVAHRETLREGAREIALWALEGIAEIRVEDVRSTNGGPVEFTLDALLRRRGAECPDRRKPHSR